MLNQSRRNAKGRLQPTTPIMKNHRENQRKMETRKERIAQAPPPPAPAPRKERNRNESDTHTTRIMYFT